MAVGEDSWHRKRAILPRLGAGALCPAHCFIIVLSAVPPLPNNAPKTVQESRSACDSTPGWPSPPVKIALITAPEKKKHVI